MRYIGIDPGISGAVAALHLKRGELLDVLLVDTPSFKVGKKNEYDAHSMARIINIFLNEESMAQHDVGCHFIIESVHSMPNQGVASTFQFGKGFGMWLGILAALGCEYTLVSPQSWKKVMLADMPKEKDAGRLRAMQLFPSAADRLSRAKDDGRADALLMAEYLRRQYNG